MALDPLLQQFVDQFPAPPEGPIDHAAVRLQAEAMIPLIVGPEGAAKVGSIEDHTLEGPGGPVPLRIFRPTSSPKGTLHFIHGGGWSIGNLAIIEPTARRLCRDLSMVVVASSYRLAPEHRFPAAFEDSLAAAMWVLDHQDELGGTSLPVIIGGDSAGGNLAAAVCIALRDQGRTSRTFDLQLLLYPAVDLRADASYPSRESDADPTLRAAAAEHCFSDYLGDIDPSNPHISPLLAEDLANLPPAVVVVLSVDPLRDEGVAYADRLSEAGVEVEVIEFEHLTHGFVHFAGIIPASAEATNEVLERMSRRLELA